MYSLLRHLKKTFPDRAMVVVEGEDSPPQKAMGLVFSKDDECDQIEIAKRPVMASSKHLDTKKHPYLALGKTEPPKMKVVDAGGRLPRNHFPVASWDGAKLNIALPSTTPDPLIRDMLMAGLPGLISERPTKESKDFAAMCEGLSYGLASERKKLEKQEAENRRQGDRLLDQARGYIESAERQSRMLLSLDKLDKEMVHEHARQQWSDIVDMVPRALQKVRVEGEKIIVLTNPIVLLGNFMGAYEIRIHIQSGEIGIFGATPGVNTEDYPHPHVRPRGDGGGCCWGNISKMYSELRTRRDYVQLISISLRLLNQFNTSDAYRQIDQWGNNYSGSAEEIRNCRDRGPGASLAQAKKCMTCDKSPRYCSAKKDRGREIYLACHQQSSPQDCVACEQEPCNHYKKRFERCWSLMSKQGAAFCMLRCSRDECSFREKAQEDCTKNNKRSDGTCPAASNCWNPCIGEA